MSTPDLHTNSYISAKVTHYSYYAWVACAVCTHDVHYIYLYYIKINGDTLK